MKLKFAVNNTVKNKCGDEEFDNLTFNYKNRNGTLSELKAALGKGWATCSALLKEPRKGRNDSNFLETELSIIEFDNSRIVLNSNGKELDEDGNVWVKGSGKTKAIEYSGGFTLDDALADEFISANAALIYTSPSHRNDWHKFRVIFVLPAPVTDADLAHSCTGYLQAKYPDCDGATKDRCRAWYGNTNAIFPLYQEVRIQDAIFDEMVKFHGKRMEAIAEQELHRLEYQREFKCDDADLEKRVAMEALGFVHPRQPGTGTYNDSLSVLTAIKNIWGDISIAQQWSPTQGRGWNIERKWHGLSDDCSEYGVWTIYAQAKKGGWKYPEWARQEMRDNGKTEIEIEVVSAKVEGQMYATERQMYQAIGLETELEEASRIYDELDCQFLEVYEKQIGAQQSGDVELYKRLKSEAALLSKKRSSAKDKRDKLKSDRHHNRVMAKREEASTKDDEEDQTAFCKDYSVLVDHRNDFRLNKLRMEIEFRSEVLTDKSSRAWLTDRIGHLNWCGSDKAIFDICATFADENAYCPIVQYLDDLKEKPELVEPGFLNDIAFKMFKIEDELANTYLKKTLIGAVKRAYNRGCVHPTMLIVYSKHQQIGKSSGLRELFGKSFYSEGELHLDDKDSLMVMGNCWAFELAEVDRIFQKKDASTMKSFITVVEDTFRAPYGRMMIRAPRLSLLLGTTNHNDFLSDETGNERYWIISIPDYVTSPEQLNLNWIVFNRDKIWANALAEEANGASNLLELGFKIQGTNNNKNYEGSDPWDEAISEYLFPSAGISKTEVFIQTLLDEVIKKEKSLQTKADSNRVGRILKRFGFASEPVWENGKTQRLWKKAKPKEIKEEALDVF